MEGPARPRSATPLAHAQRPAARSAAEPDTRLRSRFPGSPRVRGAPRWCPFSVVRDFYASGQSLRKGLTAGNFHDFSCIHKVSTARRELSTAAQNPPTRNPQSAGPAAGLPAARGAPPEAASLCSGQYGTDRGEAPGWRPPGALPGRIDHHDGAVGAKLGANIRQHQATQSPSRRSINLSDLTSGHNERRRATAGISFASRRSEPYIDRFRTGVGQGRKHASGPRRTVST
jgi:hypothetical protein